MSLERQKGRQFSLKYLQGFMIAQMLVFSLLQITFFFLSLKRSTCRISKVFSCQRFEVWKVCKLTHIFLYFSGVISQNSHDLLCEFIAEFFTHNLRTSQDSDKENKWNTATCQHSRLVRFTKKLPGK